ncbi:DNA-3-methyladenine glycosylase I [Halopseudomonas litoralis]|uniref:DNA-3-methyladenine glycosylase I n=1 Tax=Halopseudomonas litoralis TaxID=797277 RepID=A0A1H1P8L1_9GAMM|nr:DNA-3-methyladenine glycosylase I [Halopseudomonas litoralis]SDS07532.1 DNA-3-methyladenine glycosylase I [Halopseudomonas litoralis]
MRNYRWLEEYCLNRFGSREALEARMPTPPPVEDLRALSDDRYLSTIALRVFRAGLKHSVVDARWPAFEEAFFGFDPHKVVLMSSEHIERLMQDKRLIRHLAKLRSVPRNAQMVLDLNHEYGCMGNLIADWPSDNIVGLWRLLAKRGNQLGGLSVPRFLRMVGKDTFVTTDDVLAALKGMGVLDQTKATSQRDLALVQEAFNRLASDSGRPLSQLSAMLAFTVNH